MSPTACDTGQTDDVGFQQQQQRNLCLADEVRQLTINSSIHFTSAPVVLVLAPQEFVKKSRTV